MIYTATNINTSPTIVGKVGAAVTAAIDVRGKAVKFDANGGLVLAAAGEAAVGIAIMANAETVKAGDEIDVQVKEIGAALAGAAVKAGDELAAGANGVVQKATDGQFVIGTALEAADANEFVVLQITKYAKAAKAATPGA